MKLKLIDSSHRLRVDVNALDLSFDGGKQVPSFQNNKYWSTIQQLKLSGKSQVHSLSGVGMWMLKSHINLNVLVFSINDTYLTCP